MSSSDFGPFEWMSERLRTVIPEFAWDPQDPSWQTRARRALASAVGVVDEPWPEPKIEFGTPMEPGVGIHFSSREGWSGYGVLLTPPELTGPVPAVICLPGHGAGADAIVGRTEEPYQANFALQCVQRGWIALALEQVSFGRHRSRCETQRQSSCVRDSMMALLLGETITGWRVRDAMAARRALSTLPQVDPHRVATLGISGGGLTALWTAALDPEICAAGVSGYFCTMADSIASIDHCVDNYVPGFGRMMDIPDLAALVAPRWLAVESGTRDPWFGQKGFMDACRFAERVYESYGLPERFSQHLFDGDHVFKGETLFAHFERAFSEEP